MTAFISCAEEKQEVSRRDSALDTLVLDENLYGFRLGEFIDDLYERSRYRLSWTKLPPLRIGFRGEQYELFGALDGSRAIDHVRSELVDEKALSG